MTSRLSFLRSPLTVSFFIFVVALLWRTGMLAWGLPNTEHWYSYHPDERDIAIAASQLDFIGGQFNPHFFNYPSLYIYLTYTVHGIMGLFGFTHAPPQQWSVLREIILSGRIVSLLAGSATASVVYFMGREWSRERYEMENIAAFSGLLMAALPGHIQHSQFATVDVTTTFFIVLSLLFASRALRAENSSQITKQLVISALFAGFAAATKYNAVIVIIAPLVAAWMAFKPSPDLAARFTRSLLLIMGTAIGAFIIGCPCVLFAFREFWGNPASYSGFSYELLVHPHQGSGEVFQNTGNAWWYHLRLNLPYAVTMPVLLVGLIGITIYVLQKTNDRPRSGLPLLCFGVLYFLSLGFSQVRFMRYVFPLLPGLCVSASWAIASLIRRSSLQISLFSGRFKSALNAYGCIALAHSVVTHTFLTPADKSGDPRDQAIELIKFLADHTPSPKPLPIGLADNPWFWTPPFVPQDAPPGTPQQIVDEMLISNPKYALKVIGFDAQKLLQEKPSLFVMSDFEFRDKLRLKDTSFLEFYKTLKSHYVLGVCYGRYSGRVLAAEPDADELVTAEPHDYIYTDPQVRIYFRFNPPSDLVIKEPTRAMH